MNQLRFTIRNQWITRIDRFNPVAKSRNYLYAKFDFLTSEWTGVKTALFNYVGLSQPIGQLIDENGICEVPHEVLDFDGDGDFTVSVFCGDLVTVNKATVHVYETGYVDEWGGSQPPTPDVYEQILGRLNSVEQLEVESETLPEGSTATVEKSKNPETGGYIFNFGIPKGGDGEPGEDGYSPTIEVSDIEGGHAVTITDKNGSHSFNVMDGTKGDPGNDGYSPTVTVTEITGGHRVTITDAQGAHTFDVMDGQSSSITVDDALSNTSENPVQNKVITEALSGLNEDITELQTDKLDAPQTEGTSGQVLATDGSGDTYWATVGGGGVVDSQLSESSENPVQNKVITKTINETDAILDAISEMTTMSKDVDASELVWSVNSQGNRVNTEPLSIKSGSTIKYQRTAEATGKLYNPVNIYYTVNGSYTYTTLQNGSTYTFASDCEFYVDGSKVSTSDISYEDLAILAKDCFVGTLKTEQTFPIVETINVMRSELDGVDEKISSAIAPVLGGTIPIEPEWVTGYYYNSNLAPVQFSAMRIAKIDISDYIDNTISISVYAQSSAFCGIADADDTIIATWHQNTLITKDIPVNAKWLYLSDSPGRVDFALYVNAINKLSHIVYTESALGIEDYNANKTYVIGEYCMHNGFLYRCIESTTGTFDSSKWQSTTIIDEIELIDYIHPIMKLNGVTWNARGDSITAGSNGPSYVPYVVNLLGFASYLNSGIGGVYMNGCYDGSAVLQDIVTVFAGTNDFGLTSGSQTLENFESSVRTIITNFKVNNPTARLYFISPIPRFDKTVNERGLTLLDYVNKLEEVCSELNTPCLNLYERCGITADNYQTYLRAAQGDAVHPNAYGAARIAIEIANFIADMESIYRVSAFMRSI